MRGIIEQFGRRRSAPVVALAAVALLSFGARAAWLGDPCRQPCRHAADHTLVFDEIYYVNAARRIAGVTVPAGEPYASAPAGVDPNSEHPQLAKLVVAGSIELFGDGPFAWRLGSLIFGSLALLGMFVLVRAAGGGRWLAVGASALMAADNLLLVHGRIATLDIYVLAAMIWAAALYLRGRALSAGGLVGVGAAFKLVAPYVLLILAAIEGLRWLAGRRAPTHDEPDRGVAGPAPRGPGVAGPAPRGRGLASPAPRGRPIRCLAAASVSAAAAFTALLAVLDAVAAPYDQVKHKLISGGTPGHLAHMVSFAGGQVSRQGPKGIASYPWQWLGDFKPIVYLNIAPGHPAPGLASIHPAVHFLGVISPPILVLALPGLALAALSIWRGATGIDLVAVAWTLGSFVPYELLSLFWSRTSYLYYMVIVMPGVYIAVARLVARTSAPRWIVGAWMAAVLVAAILLYPLTPLP